MRIPVRGRCFRIKLLLETSKIRAAITRKNRFKLVRGQNKRHRRQLYQQMSRSMRLVALEHQRGRLGPTTIERANSSAPKTDVQDVRLET